MKTRKKPKAVRASAAASMRSDAASSAERILLHNISWQQYEQLVELFAEDRVFMTYADKQLEIRLPAFPKLTAKVIMQWLKVGKTKGYSAMFEVAQNWCRKAK